MAQQVVASIDGSTPANADDGKGIGPVGTAGALGVALAGVIAGITVAILAVFGIILDPSIILAGTSLLGVLLNLLFTYFTPSKKIIEVVEVFAKEDIDADGHIGSSSLSVTPVDPTPNPDPTV